MANNKSKETAPMASKTTQIEKAPLQQIVPVSVAPSYLDEYIPQVGAPAMGAENVESEDVVVPRLAVCSKSSPEFDANNAKYIEGLEQGDFYNSVTREIYGKEIYGVPLYEVKARRRLPTFGSGLPDICHSFDGRIGVGEPGGECAKCSLKEFGAADPRTGKPKRPECTKFLNFAFLVMPREAKQKDDVWDVRPRVDTLSILGFKSTSENEGKQLINMLNFRRRPWPAMVVKLRSVFKSGGGNTWYIPMSDNAGWLNPEAFALSKGAYEFVSGIFASGQAKVDDDTFVDERREPGDESA